MKTTTFFSHAQETLSAYIKNFLKEQKKVYSFPDKDSVHRMRVASRRLRVAFKTFKYLKLLPAKTIKKTEQPIFLIASALGKAREIDVQRQFLETLKNKIKNPLKTRGIDKIIELLNKERQEKQNTIKQALKSFKKGAELKRIRFAFNKKPLQQTPEILIKRLILKKLKDFLRYEPYVYTPHKGTQLHALRITAKKLRYTLEIFKILYGKKINRFIIAARQIQDILGDLHELDVWLSYLEKLSQKKNYANDLKPTIIYLEKKCETLRKKTYKKFVKKWHSLKVQKIWNQLKKIS